MTETKLFEKEQEINAMGLTKMLLGLDSGLYYYSRLNKDEEDIDIVLAMSIYITSTLIMEQLPEHLAALKRFKILEVLDLIHQEMAKQVQTDALNSVENRIRQSIAQLMEERYNDKPLFNKRSHWQAVYRILVDKKYCTDSNFDGFDVFIKRVMPEKVNKPYMKESVKQISQTDFWKPFNEWKLDSTTSKTSKPFERMAVIALRFKEILEENGL